MSVMESPLEVLSRAATMVQDNANEARLTTKELPTTKWRRDRRLRASEYQHSLTASSMSPPSPQQPSLMHHAHQSPNSNANSNVGPVRPRTDASQNLMVETPIDMSVASAGGKPRSPPPPYREPLPGSTFATTLARPSVITQAPPKRESCNQSPNSISDGGEHDNNASPEPTNSVCDPVIDEHFRRSLGADYMSLFKKKSSPPSAPVSPTHHETDEQTSPKHRTTVTVNGESVGNSVDDHFAKALGDTWKKLQADKAKNDG